MERVGVTGDIEMEEKGVQENGLGHGFCELVSGKLAPVSMVQGWGAEKSREGTRVRKREQGAHLSLEMSPNGLLPAKSPLLALEPLSQ